MEEIKEKAGGREKRVVTGRRGQKNRRWVKSERQDV